MEKIYNKILLTFAVLLSCHVSNGAIVKGYVKTDKGMPLVDVPVSDGYSIVSTDSSGYYTMETDKKMGYVFVITPSGYEPSINYSNRPVFWRLTTSPVDETDVADFILKETNDSIFSFITLADNQISNRHGEVNFFKETAVPDINATIDSLKKNGMNPFVLLLGDQTFDRYWTDNSYGLQEAYSDLELIEAPLYSVIGNHDHDPKGYDDYAATAEWRRNIGPTYYSFNRGGIHFVVLDDIEITEGSPQLTTNGSCIYKTAISDDQIEWLRKDLALLKDKSTPIIVALHAPMLTAPGAKNPLRLINGEALIEVINDFDNVRVVSGHTHVSYANEYRGVHENNYGAVCGAWWLTARLDLGNKNNLCRDGTPAGYSVWSFVNGEKVKDFYKGIGESTTHQFRSYDMNKVVFSDSVIMNEFMAPDIQENEVLINVWGFGPGWNIEVFENEIPLEVTRVKGNDPLVLISHTEPYLAQGKKLIDSTRPSATMHIFRVKASKSDSPLKIIVTDHQGQVFTENMERPKNFSTEMR